MTVSVAFDGTVIDTADTVTGWSLIKITSGGGTPSVALADAAYEGLNNLTTRSDNKKIAVYYDIGAGNELDFTGGGNADGDLFYIWVNFLPSPLLNTQALGGLGIMMESTAPSASQYTLFYFEGRDTYTGGWIRLAIDPTKVPSEDVGTAFDPTSVRYFGAFAYNNQGTAKYDNFVWDQCAHGKGLIVTGSSTLGLAQELIADEEANRHGVVTALNKSGTAAEILGKITLGDNVGTLATTITDEDSKFYVAEPKYYETTLKASVPLDLMGISIVGNATGDTSVILGQPVGTTQGRNGIAVVGNSTYNFGLDRDDGAVEAADLYGCSLENLTGVLSLDGNHDFNGDTMSGCGGVSVANGATIKNLTSVSSGLITLTGSAALNSPLIINSSASSSILAASLNNVIGGNITSDGSNHAIEVNATGGGSMSFDCITSGFDATTGAASPYTPTSTGNEDIYFTDSNAGNTYTVSVAAGATIPSIRSAGAIVNVVAGLVTITISAAISLVGAEIRIYDLDNAPAGSLGTELSGVESHTLSTYAYSGAGGNLIWIQILNAGGGTYEEFGQSLTMPASDSGFFADLKLDINA